MPTLDDIAAAAGVSRNAASRALSGRTKATWPSVRERVDHIRRVAAELGYRPHAAARALSERRFACAALIMGTESSRSTLIHGLLDGIITELDANQHRLSVARLSDDALVEPATLPQVLRECSADGLLVNYTHAAPKGMRQVLEAAGIPAVWINAQREVDCVHPDDHGGAHAATAELLRLGHRRIAYLEWHQHPGEHYSFDARRGGYEHAMREAGLPPRSLYLPAGTAVEDSLPVVDEWLTGPERPTAVLAYCFAEILYLGARLRGLSVPKDLSISTFMERPLLLIDRQPTATLVPGYELGRASAAMLLDKFAAPTVALAPRVIPMTYHSGDTIAPPPEA
ncbi:MAG: LacI family DNA-binding transcriptional regulator [Planctomycetota bacterium]|jgi:DNA-binding LacI/PurR family transcriptional regulator|nr:LacI family DNA-binding transcriptional regulator [Planctomycetota bacterium]